MICPINFHQTLLPTACVLPQTSAIPSVRRWEYQGAVTRLSSTEAHKGLRGAPGPSLIPGREGVLGHHLTHRGVPKHTNSRVKKSILEHFDHTSYGCEFYNKPSKYIGLVCLICVLYIASSISCNARVYNRGLWATCGTLVFIIRPGAILVNDVCTVKVTYTYFRRLVIPRILFVNERPAIQPAITLVGLFHKKFEISGVETKHVPKF